MTVHNRLTSHGGKHPCVPTGRQSSLRHHRPGLPPFVQPVPTRAPSCPQSLNRPGCERPALRAVPSRNRSSGVDDVRKFHHHTSLIGERPQQQRHALLVAQTVLEHRFQPLEGSVLDPHDLTRLE